MHRSLTDAFDDPGLLDPRTKMGRNERCWCQSGRKWKNCHLGRQDLPAVELGQVLHVIVEELGRAGCLHPEASAETCAKIAQAHTIQRKGGLDAIAEEGHVISPERAGLKIGKNAGALVPERVGTRRASTFPGFCGPHDNALFAPIEIRHAEIGAQEAFLLSLRAVARDLFMKEAEIRYLSRARDLVDRGVPIAEQARRQDPIRCRLHGVRRAERDLVGWKDDYDRAYLKADLERLHWLSIEFDDLLPIVACGAFHPEFDLSGHALQDITCGAGPFEHVCLNVTSFGAGSVMVLAWLGEGSGPAAQFARSFRDLPDERKANTAIYLACEHTENVHFRPSWWSGTSPAVKRDLDLRFRSGIGLGGPQRTGASLSRFRHVLSTASVVRQGDGLRLE